MTHATRAMVAATQGTLLVMTASERVIAGESFRFYDHSELTLSSVATMLELPAHFIEALHLGFKEALEKHEVRILESWTSPANDAGSDGGEPQLLQVFFAPLDRSAFKESTVACIFRTLSDRFRSPAQAVPGSMSAVGVVSELPLHIHEFLDAFPDAVLATDTEWNVLSVNSSAQCLVHNVAMPFRGRKLWDLLDIAECESHRPLQDMLRTRESWTDRSSPHCLMGSENRTARVVTLRISDFSGTDEFKPGHVIILRDVTEMRQTAHRDLGSNKMEAVGQLASGIAHEINTPMQYVSDNIQFLAASFASMDVVITKYRQAIAAMADASGHAQVAEAMNDAEQDADLKYIEEYAPRAIEQATEGVSRVSAIVGAMKEFAHPDGREKSPADLNRALKATLTIARNEYKYVADVVTELGEVPPVICHIGDINQVFLNLIVNAAHAVSDVVGKTGGKGQIRVRTSHEGDRVRIEIADTGCGIPAANRNKIFDPFFTTKEVGKGTGQGLAIAKSIVIEKHGGSLRFESEEGKGTTFIILLPINETAQASS